MISTLNPATEAVIEAYAFDSEETVENQVADAWRAFEEWKRVDLKVRLEAVGNLAEALHSAQLTLAEMITTEMGKTLKEARSEVEKCSVSCRLLVDLFPKWKYELEYQDELGFHVVREPLGVILGVMPWNFPAWQVLRFAVPSMLAGNSILLKHAPNVWGSAEFLGQMMAQVFPEGVYQNLKVDVPAIAGLIADRRVRGVSLTGSRAAGIKVGAQAGGALKKCVLELGGSDAYVVLEDADIEQAAATCVQSRMINAGQSCVSAKRFIVTRKNIGRFTEAMHAGLSQKKFGDPMVAQTDFGPLARKDLRDNLHIQVQQSVARGAKLALGGETPKQKGYFYPATLLTNVKPGQPAFEEELFGPVASIIEAADESQAFAIANSSVYGLGGGVFSRDEERALKLARQEMDSGMVFINDFVKSDVHAPFGGVKDSGLGRELGREGCFEFTNIKTLFVKPRT